MALAGRRHLDCGGIALTNVPTRGLGIPSPLAVLRQLSGLRARHVADHLHVADEEVFCWEAGYLVVPPAIAPQLAQLYGCGAANLARAALMTFLRSDDYKAAVTIARLDSKSDHQLAQLRLLADNRDMAGQLATTGDVDVNRAVALCEALR